jgi:hypothetical protein
MSTDLTGTLRPRPIRIAFLLEDCEHSSRALDGIFADCYGRWGGRFSLIIPCADGKIPVNYWPWLEAYDPDIVYSYVSLQKKDILELHERLSPSEYIYHKIDTQNGSPASYAYKPRYDFRPLSALSVIFRLARFSRSAHQRAPVRIIESWFTERPSRFLTDNFGTVQASGIGGIFPTDAMSYASLLVIIDPERQAAGKAGLPPGFDTISTELAAFEEYAERRAISLSLASTIFAPKLDIRAARWSGSFNLVVGSSFADRVMFWNGRLLIPAWLDNDLCCCRIDRDQLNDPGFLKVIDKLIKNRNHVNEGSGGQPQLTIRSTSIDTAQLEAVRQVLATLRPWSVMSIQYLSTLDEMIPTNESLSDARDSNRYGSGVFALPDQTQFVWSPPTARPPSSPPDHLSDAPVRQLFTQGFWCTDFVFEYDGPGSRFLRGNQWDLPRRWRMAAAFRTSLVAQSNHNGPPSPRRSRGGKLGVFVSADHPVESIQIPTVADAMEYALSADGAWQDPNAEHGQIQPSNKVLWTHPSNEARYLTGILGMTGGLQRAGNILLHPFLQEVFAKFGGTPNLPAEKVAPTVARLRKRARREPFFDLHSEREREALGILIMKAGLELKKPMDFISYDSLKESWKAYRAKYWTDNPQPQQPDDDCDWDQIEEQTLDTALTGLRRRQIMFQGHQWTCQECHYRNWVDLGALSSELSCQVCKRQSQAPVNIRWLFRPNDFLIESLRAHSVLSLVWLLTRLCERARKSFIFMGPTSFGYTQEERPEAEADLLLVIDGRTFLCEVKSSWRVLRPSDITSLIALAIRLRPDVALIGVMETGSGPVTEFQSAAAQLSAQGVEFQLVTLDGHNHQDGPHLHVD